ncbi:MULTISPECIES: hypothetical protein [unclassified Schlesneria]|uniref:hypothetical protein n=1 Tax=Schlesneria TaxID=656899 RepID=UPI002EE20935
MIFDSGATNQSIDVQIVDDSGLPVTGLLAAGFPTLKYSTAGAHADVTFPALTDLAAITTGYTSGGVKERGEGVYRLDLPDAIFAAAGQVRIRGEASGKHLIVDTIEIAPPVNTVRLNGASQTARDIGASVLLSPGTGAGQVLLTAGAIETTDSASVAAIKDKTDNLPANPAAAGSQMDLVDAPNATAIASIVTAIMNGGSIDGATLQGVLRLIAAAVIGKVAGLPGTIVTQRAIDDSKVRLSLTLDSSGNITSVITDAT